jgi:hypothetical protein
MEIWKSLIAPLIVAAIVGVAAFAFGRATAPETASIDAQIKWVDIPNPLFGLASLISPEKMGEIDKYVQSKYKMNGVSLALRKFSFESPVRLSIITLRNTTSVRSKPVEVEGVPGSLLFSDHTVDPQTDYVDKLKLKPFDPDGKVTVYSISVPWSIFTEYPVKVLHDDRKVELKSLDVTDESMPFFRFAVQNPGLVAIFQIVGALSIMIMILFLPFGIAMTKSNSFRTRFTNKKEALKLKGFVDYLQAHRPDKLVS